jgi:hypothetical protein
MSSVSSAPSESNPKTLGRPQGKEEAFVDNLRDLTPLDDPLFPWGHKSKRSPRQYLSPRPRPYGIKVAEWQKEFFGLQDCQYDASPETRPEVTPIRPSAPTIIALFYPNAETRRPISVYLKRIKILANMGEQTIIYVPPSLSQTIKDMRSDKHWYVIDDYKTVWDLPNNKFQRENFGDRQHRLVRQMDGYGDLKGWTRDPQYDDWTRNEQYDRTHLSAPYNAKAFVTYDAVLRNPFGSDRWMYVDAGAFQEDGPLDAQGIPWGDILKERLDENKFDRSISISRDTGIVIGEYVHHARDINHECWSDPSKAWLCHQFIAHAYVGSSLGMLNYSVRYMQTVDDMDANDRYSGREEYVIPWVAIRYPNTVFSIPWVRTPGLRCKFEYPIKSCYTTYGGPDTVPAIVDPISTIFCDGYLPRRPNLVGQGLYKRTWKQRRQVAFRKWYSTSGCRCFTEKLKGWLGLPDQ